MRDHHQESAQPDASTQDDPGELTLLGWVLALGSGLLLWVLLLSIIWVVLVAIGVSVC